MPRFSPFLALVVLTLTGAAPAAPPKGEGKASAKAPPQRPKGIDLALSAVSVSRKAGTKDAYLLTVSVRNLGKTEQPAGVIFRASKVVSRSTGEDLAVLQEIILPAMPPLITRTMSIEYRVRSLTSAPAVFALTKFQLLSPLYGGGRVVSFRPYKDLNMQNNASKLTGTDLVAKIQNLRAE